MTAEPVTNPAGSARAALAAAEVAAELAEELSDVVYALRVAPDMAFEYVSSSLEQLIGFPIDEHYTDPNLHLRRVDPRDLPAVTAVMEAPTGAVLDVRARWLHRDGRTVWGHHRCRKQRRDDGSVVLYGAARDVTAQVEAELALAASQQRYRLLAENASDVVFRTDTDAVVEWVSPSVTTVTGWAPEEMVGRRITEFAHPDDLDRIRSAGDTANEGGRVTFEARYITKDGDYRWLEITARPLADEDGVIVGRAGSCRDVTSEVQAWQALERSEQRFRLAMESAPTGMAVVDLERRLVEVNAALCRMLGREPSWLLAHGLADIVHPSDEAIDLRLRDEVLSSPSTSATHEMRLVRRDRATVWVQHSVGLLRDEAGVPLSYVSQFVNVTEAREAREALHFLATHDPLTQLLNRRELLARMSTVLGHPARAGRRLAVLFADLDGLKAINDTFGHGAGDRLIAEAGARIARQVRDDDLAARIGGDEFVVVLPAVGSLDDALLVAAKVRDAIVEPVVISGQPLPVGVSIGVALAEEGEDATVVLQRADAALYRAKRSGSNRIESFDPVLDS